MSSDTLDALSTAEYMRLFFSVVLGDTASVGAWAALARGVVALHASDHRPIIADLEHDMRAALSIAQTTLQRSTHE